MDTTPPIPQDRPTPAGAQSTPVNIPQVPHVTQGVETGANIPQEPIHRVLPSTAAKKVNIPRNNTGSSIEGEESRGRHVTGSSEEDKRQGEEERRLLGGLQGLSFTEQLTPEQEKELPEITVVPSAPLTSTPLSKTGKQKVKKEGSTHRPRKRSRSQKSNSDSKSSEDSSQEDAESEGLERPK